MEIFRYGPVETEYLTRVDKRLGEAIARIGAIERGVMPDLFTALIHSIVAQQISAKAAETVWCRVGGLLGDITPSSVSGASLEEVQACGLSMRKATYVKGVADAVVSGRLDPAALPGRSDAEIVAELSSLPGVGVWTAEMLLIFSLQRPDVVSWGDLAIRRGMMTLYKHKELTRERFERYRKRYSPYASVASLYLWALSVE